MKDFTSVKNFTVVFKQELVFVKELIILILLGIGASTAWLTLSLLVGAAVIKAVIYIINKIEGEKKQLLNKNYKTL